MPLFCHTAGLVSRQFIGHPCCCFTPFIDLFDIWSCSCTMYLPWSSSYVTIIFILCGLCILSHCLIIVFIVKLTIFMVGHVPVSSRAFMVLHGGTADWLLVARARLFGQRNSRSCYPYEQCNLTFETWSARVPL